MLVRQRLPDRQPPRERAEQRRDDVQQEGEDDPAPDDDAGTPRGRCPSRGRATRSTTKARTSATNPSSDLRPPGAPHAQDGPHAARASPTRMPVTLEYIPFEPLRDRRPRVPLDGEVARRLAHRTRRGSSVDERDDRVDERLRIVGRDGDRRLRRQHLAIARDVGRDDRQRAGEGAGQHHAEALLPIDGATSAFARSSVSVSSSWLRKPTTSIPSSETRSRVSSSRTASGSAPATVSRSPGARADLGPRAEQHLQPLSRLLTAREDDRCSRPPGSALLGTSTPFGITSYSPGSQRFCDAFARSETAMRWSIRSMRNPHTCTPSSSSRARPTRGRSRRAGSVRE